MRLMLTRRSTDSALVISRIISVCSLVCCALVLMSFGLFAFAQANGASKTQVAQLNNPGASSAGAHPRPTAEPRRFIDGAAHALTSPFRSFIHANSAWAVRIAATLCALLVYGLGLGYLARYARL